MIKRKTYNCIEGATNIIAPELAFVKLHRVERTIDVHTVIVSEADLSLVDLQCRHSKSLGGLYFKETIPFNNGEKINVVYEV